jgi:hypothetical protein
MWFEADEAGRPRGYRWSRAGGTTHIEPIVMGRARSSPGRVSPPSKAK